MGLLPGACCCLLAAGGRRACPLASQRRAAAASAEALPLGPTSCAGAALSWRLRYWEEAARQPEAPPKRTLLFEGCQAFMAAWQVGALVSGGADLQGVGAQIATACRRPGWQRSAHRCWPADPPCVPAAPAGALQIRPKAVLAFYRTPAGTLASAGRAAAAAGPHAPAYHLHGGAGQGAGCFVWASLLAPLLPLLPAVVACSWWTRTPCRPTSSPD